MEYLIAFAVAILGGIVVAESYVWLLPLTGWLARGAARLLPRDDREHCLEQWLADLETMPVSLARLLRCADLYRAAVGLRCDDAAAGLSELRELLVVKWAIDLGAKRMLYVIKSDLWRWRGMNWLLKRFLTSSPSKMKLLPLKAWVRATIGAVDRRAELTLVQAYEARLDQLLSNENDTRYPRLWAELVETRGQLKELRTQLVESMKLGVEMLGKFGATFGSAADEAKLRLLAAGGYRALPSRRGETPPKE